LYVPSKARELLLRKKAASSRTASARNDNQDKMAATKQTRLKARDAVARMKEYHPPLGGRVGLRLDFNENTLSCSPRVGAKLREISDERLTIYPERDPTEAIAAQHLGLKREQVLLTNGVDEAIHLVCETYLEQDHEVLIVVPTFSMYEIYAQSTGAKVTAIQAEPGDEFRFPTENVLAAITSKTRLIAVASPNNPTGAVIARKDLLHLAQAAPRSAVLVDEAYFHFCDQTVIGAIAQFSNLFVARTFSKAYGMAGFRLGILTGAVEQMKMVRKVGSPYNVNGIALACLPTALDDQEFVKNYVAQVKQGRKRLQEELSRLAVRFWPSTANFVLTRIGTLHSEFVRAMRDRGILVRDRSSDPGCDGCVRISVGTVEQMDRLLKALPEVLVEIGWQKDASRDRRPAGGKQRRVEVRS
jgi:histidinol-phosphate aminotransferase